MVVSLSVSILFCSIVLNNNSEAIRRFSQCRNRHREYGMYPNIRPNALWIVPSHPTTLPEANGSTISLTACSPLEKVPKTEGFAM